ncbi:helix-turn-helix transcriptional regulator [Photobacterium atrarenae]|uniref:AraC family transcriptional regulator n=1 Tax=Photobacterium atrarenae TaxID=865757 RepID=A0ABY5GHU5_9GAMM|nr:AraC family transcriptional regulator [Photobacterium atrarenae]UTV28834.1 AraC family transcriptional regulator [Photobacterium atrarenae]
MKKDASARFKQSTLLPWIELRIADQSSACYEAHSHDEFSFGIIDHGQADYRNRQRIHRIGRGDLVTINPADVHACNPEAGTWSYRMLFVDALTMGDAQQEVLQSRAHDYMPFANDLEHSAELRGKFLALFHALHTESSLLQAEAGFYEFLEASLGQSPAETCARAKPQPGLNRVREKLFDDLETPHQLEALAAEAQMSRYQLLRAFKHQFGLPPHAYLMDEKIKRAKIMLKSGQEISEVALKLGFADQAHFQRQFKRKLAVTPKFYQSHFV